MEIGVFSEWSGVNREVTYFTRTTRSYFRFAPPPSPRDKTASNNSPPPGAKGWTCPRGCPGGMVTGKIEPCITQRNESHSDFSCFVCFFFRKKFGQVSEHNNRQKFVLKETVELHSLMNTCNANAFYTSRVTDFTRRRQYPIASPSVYVFIGSTETSSADLLKS